MFKAKLKHSLSKLSKYNLIQCHTFQFKNMLNFCEIMIKTLRLSEIFMC